MQQHGAAHPEVPPHDAGGQVTITARKVWEIAVNVGDQTARTWVTPSRDADDGKSYIDLCRYDRYFYKLATGKCMSKHIKGLMQKFGTAYFKELMSARQLACDKALEEVMRREGDGESPAKSKKRRNKTVRAKKNHQSLLPESVVVSMDGFSDSGGTVDPFSFSMLTADFTSSRHFWVEISHDDCDAVNNIIRGIRREVNSDATPLNLSSAESGSEPEP